jgi:ribose/xylose/arabinose/galactoside ABC-type transport system permease subunit
VGDGTAVEVELDVVGAPVLGGVVAAGAFGSATDPTPVLPVRLIG